VAGLITGAADCTEFLPNVTASGKPLSIHHFRKLLEEKNWQVVAKGEWGNPAGKGWAEFGDFDHYGHEHGWKLARHIEEQLRELVEYVEGLLNAGWLRIRIVTDHGWLLLPGGLPKSDLPKCLAETRWGRCALIKESATTESQLIPWHWHPDLQIAVAPGISCFTSGREYDHGGLTLQECLIPIVTVIRKTSSASATIKEHAWRGLRCKVTIAGDGCGMTVDIRTKPADPGSTIVHGGKSVDGENSASLMVEDGDLIGSAAVLVLIDQNGTVIAKIPTSIGGDN
jgi:hypothetical protein